MKGINIIGVQFQTAGKIYDFLGGIIELRIGDQVIVDSDRGPSLATIVRIRYHNRAKPLARPLKPIMRKISSREQKKGAKLSREYVLDLSYQTIKKTKLKMRLLTADVQVGSNKTIIYFSAPQRIDFRNLVKDLATQLKTRIELKQVGARDETKVVGGIGLCGREYCCSSWLREFIPISIKMAKNQNLALNPNKVSGGCGRLLCCLSYENSTYSHLRKNLPGRGTLVYLKEFDEKGKIEKADLINQRVKVFLENGELVDSPIKDIKILEKIENSYQTPDQTNDEEDSWQEED